MQPISIYLAGLAPETEAALLAGLEDLGLTPVGGPGSSSGNGELKPSLAVVSSELDSESAFALVSKLAAAGARVAVVGQAKDPDLILRAMRAGAREFVVSGDAERLEVAVRNLARPLPTTHAGTITAFFPAKGGMGATSLATSVAGALASRSERVCLVDLDLQLGDVQSFLDLQGGYSIADVIANLRRLDRELLDTSLARHRSGVAVLAQSERIEESERIAPESIGKLLSLLRRHYAHVLVDGIRGFGEVALAALDASDRILLVVTQEVPSVRNAQRCVALFRRLGYGDDKVRIVVNRYQKGASITKEVIAQTVGLPVSAAVANDFQAMVRTVNRGATLAEEAPRAQVTRDVDALIGLLGREGTAAEKSPGILGRLFGARVDHGAR